MKNMPNMSLYIDQEYQTKLRELAKKEHRSISQQVVHILEEYLKNKRCVK